MNLHLKDKVFMVAASSSGLGFGVAESLLKEGAKVAITSRTQANIDSSIQALEKSIPNPQVKGYVVDVMKKEDINRWTVDVLSDFMRIDGLVVNAGGPSPGHFNDFDDGDWQTAFELSLMSTVRMIRCVLSSMQANKKGNILTITSSSVKEPIEHLLLSNVFRAGVNQLVKTLSFSLLEDNIRINNLIPGRIDTKRVQTLDQINAEKNHLSLDKHQQIQYSKIPAGRYGSTQEFGDVAAFLLSDVSAYIHGANIVVDGGKIRSV